MVLVRVTSEDIASGESSEDRCPVALAVKRITGASGVCLPADEMVGGTYMVHWWDADNDYHAKLPEAARRFVDAFDDGLPVKPLVFTMFLRGR